MRRPEGKKMEISPIGLLRKVLSETENGGRLRTMTRNDIGRLLGRIDSGRIIGEQAVDRLMDMLKLGFAAEKLTDQELADWLIKEVHADMAVNSIEHALVWEAIRRLEMEGEC